jgi:uncharacterized Zn finger protein
MAGVPESEMPITPEDAREVEETIAQVRELLRDRRLDAAERLIRRRLASVGEKAPPVGNDLCEDLVWILERQGRWAEAAAILAEQFVQWPMVAAYHVCREASEKAGEWSSVRAALLGYLEHGQLPWQAEGWPLLPAGVEFPPSWEPPRSGAPQHDVLVDIAIEEERPADVLRWYDQCLARGRCCPLEDPGCIAEAVADHAPGRAVALWQEWAEGQIDRKTPEGYRLAVVGLGAAAEIMAREGRQEEWARYLAELRRTHARKRRFLRMLEGGE